MSSSNPINITKPTQITRTNTFIVPETDYTHRPSHTISHNQTNLDLDTALAESSSEPRLPQLSLINHKSTARQPHLIITQPAKGISDPQLGKPVSSTRFPPRQHKHKIARIMNYPNRELGHWIVGAYVYDAIYGNTTRTTLRFTNFPEKWCADGKAHEI